MGGHKLQDTLVSCTQVVVKHAETLTEGKLEKKVKPLRGMERKKIKYRKQRNEIYIYERKGKERKRKEQKYFW